MRTAQEIVDALNAVDSKVQQVECDTACLDGSVAKRWAGTLNDARSAFGPIIRAIKSLEQEAQNAVLSPQREPLDLGARLELLALVGGSLDAAMQAQRWIEGDDSDNPHARPKLTEAEAAAIDTLRNPAGVVTVHGKALLALLTRLGY